MDSQQIRQTFQEFFSARDHQVVPSSSLVPSDPTLLFTTAGMVQFKPYFLAEREPPYLRATSVQKCFRTTDLEIVGTTTRHMTFFEMLGNFSFGDYFKREACLWAWELMTGPFGLEEDRLWATVFETDDEAAMIWESEVGVPPDRILRRTRADGNFWDMGVAGPCGPCSELLYDRGEGFGRAFVPGEELDEERYLEIWNLVFIQNLQNDAGEIVGELPKQNVDTGLGLSRLAAILQDVRTSFEIDSMAPILNVASEAVGRRYGEDQQTDVSLRVLAEHGRAMTFLIADGVMPSNEERGYVVRRLIRRAVRYARLAGVDSPILLPLVEATIELFKDTYPELDKNRDVVVNVVRNEEAKFDATLRQGLETLEEEIARAKGGQTPVLAGAIAFRLHDTYGFPLDLTRDIAKEEGLEVDLAEFETLMSAQRDRARAARSGASGEAVDESLPSLEGVAGTAYVGYERLDEPTRVAALMDDAEGADVLVEGSPGRIVLEATPFYPEGGGQIGDRGRISSDTGVFLVEDTRRSASHIVHIGRVLEGEIRIGQDSKASVDRPHREGVRQSHTATHLLHWGLREILGEHARQRGSLVEPGRLRFDFSHFERVPPDLLGGIEEELNRRVMWDDSVRALETTYEFAMQSGAMALFGEKYGDYVRVVEVGDYSKELCGGTHVSHTGQIGVIKLVGESSVGAGVRRVEALTGMDGLKHLTQQADRLRRISEVLKVSPDQVEERLEKILTSSKEMQAQLSKAESVHKTDQIEELLSSAVETRGSSSVFAERRDGRPVKELRKMAIAAAERIGSGIVILASGQNGSANLVAAVTSDLVSKGSSAQRILSEGAALLGGSAGGKPDLAIAGGPNGADLERAFAAATGAAREALARAV